MGYTALLFCPDDKTARTVTQVLSELEFAVEPCIEPFAAVKKLMGQHFDAVVVDCDNEQNATLLFKSARNSASNQTSLAVAVVEGQAGVAKAFRIGANLVLTKPINIEQAKGTLRVARGLLRKSEPAKAAPPAAQAPAKAAPKPASEAKTARPTTVALPLAPEPVIPAETKPTPAWPAFAPVANAKGPSPDDDLLDIESGDTDGKTVPVPGSESEAKPALAPSSKALSSTGAASAPAPAREPSAVTENILESSVAIGSPKAAETTHAETPAVIGSAPTFSFGGSNSDTEYSSGGGKKIFIGVAASAILAGALYFGWTHFHESAAQPGNSSPAGLEVTPSSGQPVAKKPASAPAKPSATSVPNFQNQFARNPSDQTDNPSPEDGLISDFGPKKSPSDSEGPATKPEATPLVVKGGKASPHSKGATVDAPAPSVIGIATPGAGAPPPNLIPSTTTSLRPMLQTVNVSQGVSQGLLIKKVPPSYPANALRMHIEGTVDLMATISKAGEITQVKVLGGSGQLTQAAVEAVKQWKYKPYLLNGEPVEIQTQVTVKFKLPH